MSEPIPVFIISRNRPLYLWSCLDSLYKHTKHPCRFIFGDNGSDDPQVPRVIEGFRRRGMFYEELLRPENQPDLFEVLVQKYRDLIGKYFVLVESDVVIVPSSTCWLARFVELMDSDDKLAMLGSFIDQEDFPDREDARLLAEGLSEEQFRFLIKADSPERRLKKSDAPIIYRSQDWPHSPPGRLVIFRTSAVEELLNFRIRHLVDSTFGKEFVRGGYTTGIATDVVHRHLSLLNCFDYPEYDITLRDWYFRSRPKEYAAESSAE